MSTAGFELVAAPQRAPILHVDRWSAQAERVLRRHRVHRLAVGRFWRRGGSIEFLNGVGDLVQELSILAERVSDLPVVCGLPKLVSLSLHCSVDDLDFSRLRRLRACLLRKPASLGNVHTCRSLRELTLFGLDVPTIQPLGSLQKLRCLRLNGLRRLATLRGTESLSSLREVDLVALGRLRSVAPIPHLRLHALRVTGCGALRDLQAVGRLHSLRTLEIESGPTLRSLEFVRDLSALTTLVVVNTKVASPRCSVAVLAELPRLKRLELASGLQAGLRNLTDLERLGSARALEELRIIGGGELASLNSFRPLRRLRELRLVRTPIRDGDLSVLRELPRLRALEIEPVRRHYTLTAQELDAIVARQAN